MATIPKMVKYGSFLANFLPVFTAIISVVSHIIFELFLYINDDSIHQDFAKKNNNFQQNGRIWPEIGLKITIESITCGYSKLVPGDP